MNWISIDKREIGINDLSQLKDLAMQPAAHR
jgi:hypothetical protein